MILALFLVVLILITNLISFISTANAANYIWDLWSRVSPTSSMRQLREKRDEVMKVREERSNTSSQDEFAKWARLDRQHQKLKKEYDVINSSVGAQRQKLTYAITVSKFIASKGILWIAMWYFRKSPVVWLPHNALPRTVERTLAFPFAPRGSISAANWIYSVEATIKVGKKLYNDFGVLTQSAMKEKKAQ